MLSTEIPAMESQTPQLGFDAPVGRIDVIPSGVTGKPLCFATSAKLTELLRRCEKFPPSANPAKADPILSIWAWPFCGYLASRGIIDGAHVRRLAEVAFRHVSYRSLDDISRLGQDIHPASIGIREEIVFSGSRDVL